MNAESIPVFVFDDDPVPTVYRSIEHAEGDLEAFLVTEGDLQAVYTVDGRVVRASPDGQFVALEVTEERDLADLRHRLGSDGDLVTVANEMLRRQWEAEWPRRPRWLARRLRGDGPPQI